MMYTWSRQRGPTSTASGIPAPMETGLAVGEDRPWTGDTLNGSVSPAWGGGKLYTPCRGTATITATDPAPTAARPRDLRQGY